MADKAESSPAPGRRQRVLRGPAQAVQRMTRLMAGRSDLRRPVDRIEGIIIVVLTAAFLAAVAAAPSLAGRLYQSERAAAARLHPATAVLTSSGPPNSYMSSMGKAPARWPGPGGARRSGTLTTMTAPGILGASAGDHVRVWLTRSGQPQDPPPGSSARFAAAVIAFGAVCGAAVVLMMSYSLCRIALDRRRLAAWTSEWSRTGPRWSTRH